MQAAGSPPPDLVGDMNAAQEALGEIDAGCPQQWLSYNISSILINVQQLLKHHPTHQTLWANYLNLVPVQNFKWNAMKCKTPGVFILVKYP